MDTTPVTLRDNHWQTPADGSDELGSIGFYTLSDDRAATADETTPLSRCELILTGRCNFRCPYCRNVGGKDIPYDKAAAIVTSWAEQGLYAIRFSGGEPTLYRRLPELVTLAADKGIERIAISTNGSAKWELYQDLIDRGVNDWSVSLDACCAADGDMMAGGRPGVWEKVVANIKKLSQHSYTTVGIVLTETNSEQAADTIRFAAELGVTDIRVIPAAQRGAKLEPVAIADEIRDRYPILAYRVANLAHNLPVRGLQETDSHRCGLVLDDMAIMGDQHYPCIIYMREGGQAIGTYGPDARADRKTWSETHDTHQDLICAQNCLDVCVSYNNRWQKFHQTAS